MAESDGLLLAAQRPGVVKLSRAVAALSGGIQHERNLNAPLGSLKENRSQEVSKALRRGGLVNIMRKQHTQGMLLSLNLSLVPV